MAREISLGIDSRLENVGLLGAAVGAIGDCLGFSESERANIELCVVEAVSNCVRHAYRGEPGHVVRVHIRGDDEGIEIRVLDEGLPVPEEHRVPRAPEVDASDLDSIPEGGRGTFLMHALMDAVTYGLDGTSNLLRMTKGRHPKQETTP